MKVFVGFVFLFSVCLAMVCGQPVEKEFQHVASLEESGPPVQQHLGESEVSVPRMRRATCDLLSVDTPIGSLNHSACAAHCLALGKGFKGGRCRDGVCHCRR